MSLVRCLIPDRIASQVATAPTARVRRSEDATPLLEPVRNRSQAFAKIQADGVWPRLHFSGSATVVSSNDILLDRCGLSR